MAWKTTKQLNTPATMNASISMRNVEVDYMNILDSNNKNSNMSSNNTTSNNTTSRSNTSSNNTSPSSNNSSTNSSNIENYTKLTGGVPQHQQNDLVSTKIIDFTTNDIASKNKNTIELIRSWIVFRLCQIPWLVENSELILQSIRSIVGDRITYATLRHTLYQQFCAGENNHDIIPVVYHLKLAGIGTILDYGAESSSLSSSTTSPSVSVSSTSSPLSSSSSPPVSTTIVLPNNSSVPSQPLTSLTTHEEYYLYDTQLEEQYNRNMGHFLDSIKNAAATQGTTTATTSNFGYAAIKITALGNPYLLERMSIALRELDNVNNNNNNNNRYELFEPIKEDPSLLLSVSSQFWSSLSSNSSTSTAPVLSSQELDLIRDMYIRAQTIANAAVQNNVRLLVDAEQTQYQPAIDQIVSDLQIIYNSTYKKCAATNYPVVYNTYQCYLKDSYKRLRHDVEHSVRYKYHVGVKLVRGAYMDHERAVASSMNVPSPIHDTIEGTHDNYNKCVKYLLDHHLKQKQLQLNENHANMKPYNNDRNNKSNNNNEENNEPETVAVPNVEIMVATHNQDTLEMTLNWMREMNIDQSSMTVSFAQLYGMMDHLTYPLGANGYRVYKYVTYGPVSMVIPYLIRRAKENRSILSSTADISSTSSSGGGATRELQRIQKELYRRFMSMFSW